MLIDRACEVLGVDCTKYVRDARPFMTTEEIQLLAREGFTIGAHSCTHARLGELRAEEVEKEIVGSCRKIQAITGQRHVPFAFPFSAAGVDSGLMGSLQARNTFIGRFFDCRGIRRNDPLLVDRVWADAPPEGGGRSNVGELLRKAYAGYLSSLR
jgi:peptidoglycan/xylan/chitin deacetylase (PgdA/CDA1 family)